MSLLFGLIPQNLTPTRDNNHRYDELAAEKKNLLPRRCFAGCFSFIVFKASRGVEMNNSQSAAVETTSPKANPLRPISNQRCATNTTPFA